MYAKDTVTEKIKSIPISISFKGSLFALCAVVFVAEVLSMTFVRTYFHLGNTLETILDASILLLVVIPFVYFVFVRRNVEQAESLEELRALYEGMADGVIVADIQTTRFLKVNSSACSMLGYTHEELLELHVRDIHPPDNLSHAMDLFKAMATGQTVLVNDLPFLTKDGSVIELDVRGNMLIYQGRACLVGFFRDLTQFKMQARSIETLRTRLEYLISASPVCIYACRPDGDFATTLMSTNVKDLLGYEHEQFLWEGSFWFDHIHPDDRQRVRENLKRLSSKQALTHEYRFQKADNSYIWLRDDLRIITDDSGAPREIVGSIIDITDQKHALEALERSEAVLEEAQRIAHIGNWVWDIKAGTLSWSDEIYSIFGLRPQEFQATYEVFFRELIHPSDRALVDQSVREALEKKAPYDIDHRIVLADGSERTVHERGEVVFSPEGKPIKMLGTVQDVTERTLAERELKRLSLAIEESINLIYITDAEGNVIYVNHMFEEALGYTKAEVIRDKPKLLVSITAQDRARTRDGGSAVRGTFKYQRKDGEHLWGRGLISPISNTDGEVVQYLTILEDITEQVRAEEKAKYLETYDKVTGLYNRDRFVQSMDKMLAKNTHGALLLVDVDGFKFINDAYGHTTGDEFLKRAAALIEGELSALSEELENPTLYTIGRVGEDEFAIFLATLDPEEALEVAEGLRKKAEGYRFMEVVARATLSVGVTLYPEHADNSADLLTKADAAVFKAKEFGKNRTHLFKPQDRSLEILHRKLREKDDIIDALEKDLFVPWYQPILRLEDDVISHHEALARIRLEDGTVVHPGEFIATAERFGLIGRIDRTIMEKTLRYQGQLALAGIKPHISLNISGKNMNDPSLLVFLRRTIEEQRAIPQKLIFEITETSAIEDLNTAVKFVRALKDMGCSFSLDDFGVGFTSFVYLRELHLDYIKIDGSFIRALHERPEDQVLVRGITELARGMNIKTVAEFVETSQTLELLREMGVNYAQGYLIGRPVPEIPEVEIPAVLL